MEEKQTETRNTYIVFIYVFLVFIWELGIPGLGGHGIRDLIKCLLFCNDDPYSESLMFMIIVTNTMLYMYTIFIYKHQDIITKQIVAGLVIIINTIIIVLIMNSVTTIERIDTFYLLMLIGYTILIVKYPPELVNFWCVEKGWFIIPDPDPDEENEDSSSDIDLEYEEES